MSSQQQLQQLSQNPASSSPIQLPEILHLILLEARYEFWYEADQTMLGCTLVNRLWNYETNKVLWEFVGQALGNNKHPLVRHLIAIDRSRRQQYANHIRTLYIRGEEPAEEAPERWEGRFHADLTSLEFPALEEFVIESPRWQDDKLYQPIEAPLPYAQARLRRLEIWNFKAVDCLTVDDGFLQALSSGSKNLKELMLSIPSSLCTVSKPVFSSFFQGAQSLNKITIACSSPALSPEAFFHLSRMPALEQLCIHTINSDWVQELDSGSFPSLTRLECRINSRGLTRLLEITSSLETLKVKAAAGSTDLLRAIAQAHLHRLNELDFTPAPQTKASVRDLRNIAEMAPNLEVLCIPSQYEDDMDFDLEISDINDEELKGWAKLLPKLKVFTLLFDDSKLTERSLINVGLECPLLTDCSLSIKVDYEKLAREAVPGTFANLTNLTIVDPADDDEEDEATSEDLEPLARQLLRLMPEIKYPDFPAKSDLSMLMIKMMIPSGQW